MEHLKEFKQIQYVCAKIVFLLFSELINFRKESAVGLKFKKETAVASITLDFQQKIVQILLNVMNTHKYDSDLLRVFLTINADFDLPRIFMQVIVII